MESENNQTNQKDKNFYLIYWSKVAFLLLVVIGSFIFTYIRATNPPCQYQGLITSQNMQLESVSIPLNISQLQNDGFDIMVLCKEDENNSATSSFLQGSSFNISGFNPSNPTNTSMQAHLSLFKPYSITTCKEVAKYLVKPKQNITLPATICYTGDH